MERDKESGDGHVSLLPLFCWRQRWVCVIAQFPLAALCKSCMIRDLSLSQSLSLAARNPSGTLQTVIKKKKNKKKQWHLTLPIWVWTWVILICLQLVEHRSDTQPPLLLTVQTAGGPGVSVCNQFKIEVYFCISIFKETAISLWLRVCVSLCTRGCLFALQLSWLILPHSTSNHGKECCSSCLVSQVWPRHYVELLLKASHASRVSPFQIIVLVL